MKRVQRIRHTTGNADIFTGLEGEITVDVSKKTIRVHDGITPGGVASAVEDLSTTQAATNLINGKMTSALVLLLEAVNARLTVVEANILPATTTMVFWQAAAPVGWTQQIGHADAGLRIVNGVGGGFVGSQLYSACFGPGTVSASTTLTAAQIPAHIHGHNLTTAGAGSHSHTTAIGRYTAAGAAQNGFPGGDNAVFSANNVFASTAAPDHTHTINGAVSANTGGDGGHVHGMLLNPITLTCIICSKDAF